MTTCEIGLQLQFDRKYPFVIYSKPNSDKTTVLLQDNTRLYRPSKGANGFVFFPYDGKKGVLLPATHTKVMVEPFHRALPLKDFLPDYSYTKLERESFETKVKKAILAIATEGLQKVVLSRKETVACAVTSPYELYKHLKNTYYDAFCYVYYHPKVGLWAGATPELLIKKSNLTLTTVSLAGTQLYQANKEVSWGKKEIREQQLVTAFIQKAMRSNCTQTTVTKAYTQKAGNLLHLKSEISGELHSAFAFQQVVQKLHPTPAVCGVPKRKALRFIKENEGYDRMFYTGFLGEWQTNNDTNASNSSELYVNLRCMNILDTKVNLFVGCGITKDSDPELEFLETVNKAQTMKRILKEYVPLSKNY